TSYKTRQSLHGEPVGCMDGTRVGILADLEAWASNDDSTKLYWLVGMAGTGKSTICQTFCEILYAKNVLGASFFCSRASDQTSNARLIIPTIAYELAHTSPPLKSEVVKALENDAKLAEPTYLNLEDQFKKLIHHPIRASVPSGLKTYKVVIDGLDECTDLKVVASFIKLVLQLASQIPLKICFSSRDETLIRKAFHFRPDLCQDFYLHEIKEDVVRADIRRYLQKSLSEVNSADDLDEWPSNNEISTLVARSGGLFIYAATVVRYIEDGEGNYKSRLTFMVNQAPTELQTSAINNLYGQILNQACAKKEPWEVAVMRELVTIILFLRNSLPAHAIMLLSGMNPELLLGPLKSVIHVPSNTELPISSFHASFPDFVTNPVRCSPTRCPSFTALVALEGHEILALKCLEIMNSLLRYNIRDVPKELVVSRQGTHNLPTNFSKISGALKYACLYWASHLGELQVSSTNLITALSNFLRKHLLHWIECLSTLGELETGLVSLGNAGSALSVNAHRCLQLSFVVVQQNCMEIYRSALVWIPKKSILRALYAANMRAMPQVSLGLSTLWGPLELTLPHQSALTCVAFSPDGRCVVSGSQAGTVLIWNANTGEVEANLGNYNDQSALTSVAFSPDGRCVVSGSQSRTVLVWNVNTGEIEANLGNYTDWIMSAVFLHDGSRVSIGSQSGRVHIWNMVAGQGEADLRSPIGFVHCLAFSLVGSWVVSGRSDNACIWNLTTGEAEVELRGHTDWVTCVVFSQDGSRVVSGSDDQTVRLWNAMTGDTDAVLRGHTNCVISVAFSWDGSHIVSGSDDMVVYVWNATTREVELELRGHTGWVRSVAFSQASDRVVSGSEDNTIHIWNTKMGELSQELTAHMDCVNCIAFSLDGSRVASGSGDRTVRIWNTTTGDLEAELRGHTHSVSCVAFSQDGSQVVSGSRDWMVCISNAMTGELERQLQKEQGIADMKSVAFSHDGCRVVAVASGEVHIWNVMTGKLEKKLGGPRYVISVAFSQDGCQVATGSSDGRVSIWDAMPGILEALEDLWGHTRPVSCVAFSQDGTQVISGSYDGTVRIWNPTTWDSEVMSTLVAVLPDATEIQIIGSGEFHISYPAATPKIYRQHSISTDEKWILSQPGDCWIPPSFRDYQCCAFSGSKISFGYRTGKVVILDTDVNA
ncbi:hypothetical protein B0H13DRAFT_1635836, partial [Mycena leptocephala]